MVCLLSWCRNYDMGIIKVQIALLCTFMIINNVRRIKL
jgi:hypothetical protein